MKKYIIGNWKMNGNAALAHTLAEAVAAAAAVAPQTEVVLCPPATLITQLVSWLIGAKVRVGAQDCSPHAAGAYTGDISAAMLEEAGCAYVIVGHSERRQGHGETSGLVQQKALQAMQNGLTPIICIGETQAEREAGVAQEVVGQQVIQSIPSPLGRRWREAPDEGGATGEISLAASALTPALSQGERGNKIDFLLAYEPVWAIGSGKVPAIEDIRQMHAYIVDVAAKRTGLAPERIWVLYGGSVNAANAGAIMAIPHVAGVLVGGASLKAEEFCKIVASGQLSVVSGKQENV